MIPLEMEGVLTFTKATGEECVIRNNITDNESQIIALALGGAENINLVKFGVWPISSPQPTYSGMQDLEAEETFVKKLDEKVYEGDDSTTAVYKFSLSDLEIQRAAIKEYALFMDNTMFSRVHRSCRTDDFFKDEETEVFCEWRITIKKIYNAEHKYTENGIQ